MTRYRKFSFYLIFFLVGIFGASFLPLRFSLIAPAIILLIACLLFSAFINQLWQNHFLVFLSFAFIFFGLGLLYYSYQENQIVVPDSNRQIEVVGKTVSQPVLDFKTQKFNLEVTESADSSLKNLKILVTTARFPEFQYADRIKLAGTIKKPATDINGFNYADYLKRYGVGAEMTYPGDVSRIPNAKLSLADRTVRALYSINSQFESAISRVLPEPHASLGAGILLGAKKNMPEDFKIALQNTGLTHIIALSGYNVTIIVSVLSLAMLGIFNRKQVFIFGTLAILVFVVMTGASSSVVRAAILSILLLFGRTLGRKGDKTNLLLFTAVIIALSNPLVVRHDLGFQLSFVAFAGLIYLSPILSRWGSKCLLFAPDLIRLTLIETLSAQLAVLPLILFQFGIFSLVAPLANVLVIWIIPLTMALVFVVGLGSLIFYPLGKFLLGLAWLPLQYIIGIVKWCASLPFASFQIGKGEIFLLLGGYALIFWFIFYWYKKFKLTVG